jgi:predicted aspartyl protease
LPAAECGFPSSTDPSPAEALVENGPTLWIDIEACPSVPSSSGAPIGIPALVDTGANLNAIDDSWAQQSQFPIVDRVPVSGIGGSVTLNVYFARIRIERLGIDRLGRFTGVHLQAGGQSHMALLGRDLLKDCHLVYDGPTGSVVISRP